MTKVTAIIPSRFASSRLPGKPLIDLGGKTLIQRVCEQVAKAKFIDRIIVATDDKRIFDHVEEIGFAPIMTSVFDSGTDRIASVAVDLESDFILNIQGDEPLINPNDIDCFVTHLLNSKCNIATLRHQILKERDLFDFNKVKVVVDKDDNVLFFSRQAIPAQRDLAYSHWLNEHDYYQHIGIYGFRKETLLEIANLSTSSLEKSEKLEQLRWMQSGYRISCMTVEKASMGIDTPEDVDAFLKLLA